ncbi:unnamed protein product [Phytomonas sp. Hart1]|nr:unnamed protein product [Phytomonas sp. Hart1]|eukprot:CCW67372.1 unnamed protein product [Phytomonas sp. isolate Hart1]
MGNNSYNQGWLPNRGEIEEHSPEIKIQRMGSTGYSDWNSVKSPASEGDINTAGEISIKSRTSSFKEILSGGKRGYRHNPYSFHADS